MGGGGMNGIEYAIENLKRAIENLERAKDRIGTPDRWYQGDYYPDAGYLLGQPDDEVPCCAIGAVWWARSLRGAIETPNGLWQEVALLNQAAQFYGHTQVYKFNDDPVTRHEQVMDVFDRAIRIGRERLRMLLPQRLREQARRLEGAE